MSDTTTAPQHTFDEGMREAAEAASSLLKALSHENRLLILCLLAEGEKPVTELEQTLGMRQPAVSQQLARLRADELVSARRDGKAIYYSIASDEARQVIELLYKMFCEGRK
ncbi:ArsR/SmtB family transcription factor [Limibacillus halophilus]|jgi:DNA-binding transcriptional ArsR family regulator